MERTNALCSNTLSNRARQMLALLVVALLGASWLMPCSAQAETAPDWNQAACRAFGNCATFHALHSQRSNIYQRRNSAGAVRIAGRGFMQLAQRSSYRRFSFEPIDVASMASQGSARSVVSNLLQVTPLVTATSDTWKGGTGNWSDASDWSTGEPTSSNNVFICGGCSTASPVTLDVSSTINNLTIDSNSSLTFNNGISLTVDGSSISNAGKITLNSSGSATELIIGGPAVTMTGTLTTSNNAANFIFGSSSTNTLINDGTIEGAGVIGDGQMGLVNSGTINANQSAGLTIRTNGVTTNNGTIEATGGTLTLSSMTLNNLGTISDSGQTLAVTNSQISGGTVTLTGGADLQLSSSTIQGGTLTNSSTGTIEALSFTNDTLGGTITNPTGGVIKLDNGATLNLEGGTYSGLGAVQMDSTGNGTSLQVMGGNVTLSGGSLTLTNNANNVIFGSVTTDTLTNEETIAGAGNIGDGRMTLVNTGTINANGSAGLTIQANGGVTNTGTIEATEGTLTFNGTTVTNNGGKIVDDGQTMTLTESTINGGTVTVTGAGDLQLTNSSTIEGGTLTNSSTGTIEALSFTTDELGGTISNPAGGVIKADNGATLNLQGGTYTGLGAVQLNSTGNATQLQIVGDVTLSGGSLTLSNSTSNLIFGTSTVDTLTNEETISGAGNLGDGRMTLVNSGTINANQSSGLTIQANGGVTNTGTIEATEGTLTFNGTTVTNNGGKIVDDGQTMTLTESTINGGTVTVTGAGDLQLTNSSTIEGGTLTNSSTGTIEALSFTTDELGGTITNPAGGVVRVDNGATLNLKGGTYTGLGAVQLNSTGNATQLQIIGDVTLSGGSLTLSNSTSNLIFGLETLDTLTNEETISGAGNLGEGRMTLVNTGTINDNQSSGMTIQANGGATNTGTIEATGGTLTFTGMTVNNAGGKITDSGQTLTVTSSTINGGTITLTGASDLQLNNSTIQNGTLTNSASGTIEALSFTSNTLGGTITNPTGGVVKVDNGATLSLNDGTYASLGAVQVNSTGNGTNLELKGGNVTLSGGSVTMSDNAANFILSSASTNILTNQETIQGAGNIGENSMGLVNSGTISANQGTPLFIQTDFMGFTNNGTLAVGSGDVMHVETGPFTNFVGSTLIGGTYNISGTLEIDELGSTGGEILTDNANIILNGASSSFVDSASKDVLTNLNTIGASGGFTIEGGRNFTTVGNFTNDGTLGVGGGSTFAVTGNLTNFSGTTLTGGTYNVTGTLKFPGANIVTNDANITLNGASSAIINSTTSANGLANLATNGTGSSFTIEGGRNFTTAGNFTNNGALTVGAGSTFDVKGSLNSGSTTLTGGPYNVSGILEAAGLNIVTNDASLTLNGASAAITNTTTSKSALASLATNDSGVSFTVEGGDSLTTAAAFANNGTLTVTGSGSKFTVNGSSITNAASTGTINVNSGGNLTDAGTLTNNGTFNVGGGTVNVNGSTATNSSGATLTVNGAGSFTDAGTFTNSGTLAVGTSGTGGTAGSFSSGAFTNNKTMTEAAGSSVKTGNLTNTGTMTLGGGTFSMNGTTASNSGTLSVGNGANFTTTGNFSFSNSGIFTIASGGSFNVGASGSMTQSAGTTTDDGSLTAGSGDTLTGGSLFGKGTITGNLTNGNTTSGAVVRPGDSPTATGILTDSAAYTQSSKGTLDISIGGTTAGTNFDQLNSKTASLNGTLNISLINSFVPTIDSTFKILDYTSETGTFATVNGLAINSSEHFTLTVQGTDVLLTVVSGALAPSARHLVLRPPAGFAGSRFSGALRGLRLPSAVAFGRVPQGSGELAALSSSSRPDVPTMHSSMPILLGMPQVRNAGLSGNTGLASRPGLLASNILFAPGNTLTQRQSGLVRSGSLAFPVSSNLGASFTAVAAANGFSASVGHVSQGTSFSGTRLTASSPFWAISGPRRGVDLHFAPGLRANRNSGMGGLRSRAVVGGFAIPITNHLSKPQFGFAVD
jgi:fibronectin-binding autotransporter adhesin